MLNLIIRFALNNRLLVASLASLILVLGFITLRSLPVDVFPDLNRPIVTIMTEAPGMAPEEVETLVTLPLETQLNGLPGVIRVRSSSGIGLAVIYAEFDWGTDIYRNRQLVAEKLSQAQERLPANVVPVMAPVASIMGEIQLIAVSSPKGDVSPMQLREVADWTIRPRLLSIPGIAQVIPIGGGVKQYQIRVSGEKMQKYQIVPDELEHQLEHLSVNTTGGFLSKEGQEYLVRNIGAAKSAEEIANTVVGMNLGTPVLIKDIAEVVEAPKVKRGDGGFGGQPAVIMSVQKQPGADTVKLTGEIEQALKEMQPSLPQGVSVNPDVFKQANFIRTSIENVEESLRDGTILVFLVLLVFLASLRTTAITLTAIPLSFLVAALVFKAFGLSVNTMTLGGLAIAIGELVDDAIVDVENVFRRLRENRQLAKPKPALQVIYAASSEVRNSIVLATMIVILVFIPLFSLSGIEGRLFIPLGIAYIVALLASLVVSLTVTPVMCSWLLSNAKLTEHKDTWLVRHLKSGHRWMLERTLPRPWVLASVAAILMAVALSLIPFMGRNFLPHFNEGTAVVTLIATPGISLEESNALGQKAEKLILSVPEVKSVSRRVGRAELDEHAEGVNVSELDVDFKETGRPREEALKDIRKNLATLQDVGSNVGQPISHRIDHMMSGVRAQIAIKVFGPDLATLRAKAAEVENAIKEIPELVDVQTEQQKLVPQVKVRLMRDEAARYGVSVGELAATLEMAFNGKQIGQVVKDQRYFDIQLQFDDASRGTVEAMQNTPVKLMPDGSMVKLAQVADVYEANGPNQINRENSKRRIVISANATGSDLNGVVETIQKTIAAKVEMPEGYYVAYDGQFESQQRATRQILMLGALSLLGIALILYGHFRSAVITAQIMVTIPMALMGGVFALYLTGQTFNMASMVGFITLCGIASRNGIMMLSHQIHLITHEGETFSREMVIRGALERLVPVLMTASTATLALLPLAFSFDVPGREILQPVALVIVGGLVSSTLLDLLLTPTLFYKFGQRVIPHLGKEVERV